ncbi:MAG TPA: nitrile hydratase subunit beta [Alphaproteobacteria bacterium]|nr:nitrile hydratase subunit beta [Alphaproteobacteria bacterium]
MNGIHDMGGMHGMGPVEIEPGEPVFHAPWEGRVLALNLAMGAWRKWNIDASRHEIELIPPAQYLRMSYYEKWLARLVALALKSGLVSRTEVESGRPDRTAAKASPALVPAEVGPMLGRGAPATRDVAVTASFKLGDRVRARNIHPLGHTRLPRYARGKLGSIARDHGVHVFPDSRAHFRGENPQHLYSVRFAARELWGEAVAVQDAVYLDLWDDYLERA